MKQTIAVFGATGRTGVPFVKQALANGFHIRALIRTLNRVPIQHPNLTWIAGDVLEKVAVDTTLQGTQAVVSLIGHVNGSPADLQTIAIRLVIECMNERKITRLISLTGGGVRNEQTDQPGLVDKLIVFSMKHLAGTATRDALLDGMAHAAIIRQSGLQWTIVRGPMLTDDPAKGHYKVGAVGTVNGFKLTREDLANFILDALTNGKYIGAMPFLAN